MCQKLWFRLSEIICVKAHLDLESSIQYKELSFHD